MNSSVDESPADKRLRLFLVLLWLAGTMVPAKAAVPNVAVRDSGLRFADAIDAEKRNEWKIVPTELFALEAEPLKAASDPGYYGREYSFSGDAVVETRQLTAVFWSARGQIAFYAKTNTSANASRPADLGRKIFEFVPGPSSAQAASIRRCEIIRNAGDEVMIKASFSGSGQTDQWAIFSFDRTEIVGIKPSPALQTVSLLGSMAYGIVPSFIGDDLIFNPADLAEKKSVHLPSEQMFLGLLPGQDSMVVMTWPKGNQQLTLQLKSESSNSPVVAAIEFSPKGQSFFLAPLTAPGIWHRETFKASHLEKDVPTTWKRPFPAKWKTQLSEAGLKTSFAFRDVKGTVWRGVPGSYNYPVWFEDDKAVFHLSKKIPPKGEALVYFLEGRETPPSITTPVDILKATLGRPDSESILDPEGRKLRTHHRRGGDSVHRACTCGYTEAIQVFFEKGQEVAKKAEIAESLADMIYFVEGHVERIGEYKRFAEDTIKFLQAEGRSHPGLKPFLDELEAIPQQILQEQKVQQENMKSSEYTADLTQKTLALCQQQDANNLKVYMDLLKAWRAMGGAQDYVVAQSHTLTRKLFQTAGYGCGDDAQAVTIAEELRNRCRQCLRNPDGYEIWADY